MAKGKYTAYSTEEEEAQPGVPPPYTNGFDTPAPSGANGTGTAPAPGPVPVIKPGDIVIAVMGVTGAGKSTFISHFAPQAVAGHGLASCTKEVEIHQASLNGQTFWLIDTPGFDDTNRSDTDILRELANWLNQSYREHIQLAGIVYLHRIVDNRMGGAAMKNLRMFCKLCGDDCLSNVVLATTMWDMVGVEEGIRREKQLATDEEFWGRMRQQGSQILRHDSGRASAEGIMRFILGRQRRFTTRLQQEMAGGKTLDQTAAGQEVQADMLALKKRYEEEMKDLRREMEDAQRRRDVEAQREIAAVRADLEARLRKDREDRDKMRVGMEQLRVQRMEELQKQRDLAHQRELSHQKEMMETRAALESQRLRNDADAKNTELRLQLALKQAENARYERMEAERKRKEQESCTVM